MTLWSSSVFTLACLTGSYRFSEFRNSNTVGEGVAVTGVVHQNTRQEHGAQVVSVQNVHSQSRGSRSSVWWVRSAVLHDEQKLSISTVKLPHNLLLCALGLLTAGGKINITC